MEQKERSGRGRWITPVLIISLVLNGVALGAVGVAAGWFLLWGGPGHDLRHGTEHYSAVKVAYREAREPRREELDRIVEQMLEQSNDVIAQLEDESYDDAVLVASVAGLRATAGRALDLGTRIFVDMAARLEPRTRVEVARRMRWMIRRMERRWSSAARGSHDRY